MKWFKQARTIEELKKQYKELLKKHHPDCGGEVADMQEINREFDILSAKMSHENKSDEHSYTQEESEEFRAILNEIIGYNMTIEVIGSWVWCTNCYPYKDQLKALGFTWCSRKKAWVWHSEPYHRYHKKEVPLSQIKAKYGSQTIKKQSYQCQID